MTRCVVVAVLLTLVAGVLDWFAIADWRQNAVDTAGMVASMICIGAWLYVGLLRQQAKTDLQIAATIRAAQRRADAAETLDQLTMDQPTLPLPIPLRRAR